MKSMQELPRQLAELESRLHKAAAGWQVHSSPELRRLIRLLWRVDSCQERPSQISVSLIQNMHGFS